MKSGVVKKAFPFAFDGINVSHLLAGQPFPPETVPPVADNTFDGLVAAGYIEESKGAQNLPPEEQLNRDIIEALDRRLLSASDQDLKDIIARSGTPYSGNLVHANMVFAAKQQMLREMDGSAQPVLGVDPNSGVTEQPLAAPGAPVPNAASTAIQAAAEGDAQQAAAATQGAGPGETKDAAQPTGTTSTVGAGENKATNQFGDPMPGRQQPKPDQPSENLDEMTVAELKEHAEKNKVDLGDATKKADIIAAIKAAK